MNDPNDPFGLPRISAALMAWSTLRRSLLAATPETRAVCRADLQRAMERAGVPSKSAGYIAALMAGDEVSK